MTSSAKMLALSAGFLGVGLFIGRPYCRWLCPYGAILSFLSRLSWRHLQIPPKQCVQCRLCEDACPYGAIRRPTVPLPAEQRSKGRRGLIAVLAAAPLLVAIGAGVGYLIRDVLAFEHPQSSLPNRSAWKNPDACKRERTPARLFAVQANRWIRSTRPKHFCAASSRSPGRFSVAGLGWCSA